jgi:ABC-type nitrate/sulfonate/bicarbonate transport system substrate-binding protein
MRKLTLLTVCGWIALILGCASPIAVPAPNPTEPKGTIRFSYPASPGLSDVPFFMALDKLRADGYIVETTQFARFDLNLAALVQGDLDIASSSIQPAWAAVAQGAPIRTIVGRLRNADVVVTKTDIKTCADLANKNVGVTSAGATNAVMLKQYIDKHCPGTTINSIIIASSNNRMPALIAGSIDAANLQLDDLLEIEHEAPGRFHALVHFAQENPNIEGFAFHAHTDFAEKHPVAVRAFIRALLQAQRDVQNKQTLRDAATKYLPLDAPTLDTAVSAYIEQKMWSLNGALTADNIRSTLDFFVQAQSLPADLTPERIADLSYLNAVLDEIGRQ